MASRRLRLRNRLAVFAALLALTSIGTLQALPARAHNKGPTFFDAPNAGRLVPHVSHAVAMGVSKPVRDMPVVKTPDAPMFRVAPEEDGARVAAAPSASKPLGDGAAQTTPPTSTIGSPTQDFEGVDIGESSSDGVFVGAPPDTNGDVGPNHYVQIVNTVFAIYSKTGQLLSGPTPINDLWGNNSQFNCSTQSRGDPIVQYDPLADRWLISQFNFPGTATIAPPFDQCFAISKTPDPTGDYFLYDFNYSNTVFNDYPHIGVWPDAYYTSFNQYDMTDPNESFLSAGACAYERAKMLKGEDAQQVCFHENENGFDPKTRNSGGYEAAEGNSDYLYHGQLPSDLDGTTPPPSGEPNFFMQMLNSKNAGQDKLLLFKFHVDWADPSKSWFGSGPTTPAPVEIPVADFDPVCNQDNTLDDRDCIPQKDANPNVHPDPDDPTGTGTTTDNLDSIGDRLMYRLAYRNFGGHESIVLNHTVSAGAGDTHVGGGHAAIRWYEIRDPNGTPVVKQQSTFAPDANHRWMGSAAMDALGDLALGYSESSATMHPAISYAARAASDTPGVLTQGEGSIIQGTGSQLGTGNRWGDYSSLSVDPDGCTFWYTTEYYAGTGSFNWNTRIGSFSLPSCGDPRLSLQAANDQVLTRSDTSYTIQVFPGQHGSKGSVVTDTLPAGATLLSATSTMGTCSGAATVTCQLGDVPAGKLVTIVLTVHLTDLGDFSDAATLATTSADSNTANNSATVGTRVWSPCTPPGLTLLTDPKDDSLDGDPSHDVLSDSIAEPYTASGGDNLVFTMKVQSLASPTQDTTWPISFVFGKDKDGNPQEWYVAMHTDPVGNVSYYYGKGEGDDSGGDGALEQGSGFNADGTITLILKESNIKPDSGETLGPGQHLTAFLTRIRQESLLGPSITPDNMPGTSGAGDYPLLGGAYCAPDNPPTASLTGTPKSGDAPLAVAFDASGSSDPDSGDGVASYTFTFGDASPPVTKPTPTVSHTYKRGGTFHATVTVRDNLGLESGASAPVDITVKGNGPGPGPTPADCTIVGTAGADVLAGTKGSDIICGLGGNDRIVGKGGADFIFGGDGDDTIKGGDGKDTIQGDAGSDVILGGSGRDVVRGGADRDRIYGGTAGDRLFAQGGNDVVNAGSGNDHVYGGGGADTLFGGSGLDVISGGSGADVLDGQGGSDRCSLGPGGIEKRHCEH